MKRGKFRSSSVKDVNQQRFTKAFAKFLKKSGKVKVPEWTDIVKTACYKELAPFSENWYYVRVAAVARHIYIRSPVGVGGVKKIFGGRINRGSAPSHYIKASGAVSRRALQTLEALKLVEKHPNGGRRLTSQGFRDLDRIAAQIKFRSKPKAKPKSSKVGKKPTTARVAAGKVVKPKGDKAAAKKPADKKEGDKKSAAKKPAEKGDKKAAAKKPEAKDTKKAAEKKPAEKKAGDKKAADKKSAK